MKIGLFKHEVQFIYDLQDCIQSWSCMSFGAFKDAQDSIVHSHSWSIYFLEVQL